MERHWPGSCQVSSLAINIYLTGIRQVNRGSLHWVDNPPPDCIWLNWQDSSRGESSIGSVYNLKRVKRHHRLWSSSHLSKSWLCWITIVKDQCDKVVVGSSDLTCKPRGNASLASQVRGPSESESEVSKHSKLPYLPKWREWFHQRLQTEYERLQINVPMHTKQIIATV